MANPALSLNGTATWTSITFGFVGWRLDSGYLMGMVNNRLATVKTYARIAFTPGIMTDTQFNLIQTVQGYRLNEARHSDERRKQTRKGTKKPSRLSLLSSKSLR